MRRGAVEVGRQAQDRKRRGELAPPVDRPRRRAHRPRAAASARAHGRRTGGERGERRRPSRGEGLVERRDLARENDVRPPSKTMWWVVRSPACRPAARRTRAKRRRGSAREVERAPPLLGGEARGLGPPRRLRKAGEVDERQRPAAAGATTGSGAPARRGEGGAQVLVPADHLVERAGEEGGVERARDGDGVEEVVGRRAGVDLVEEPHPLLGEGERGGPFLPVTPGRTVCRGSAQVGCSARVSMTNSFAWGRRWVKDTPQRLRPAQVESAADNTEARLWMDTRPSVTIPATMEDLR